MLFGRSTLCWVKAPEHRSLVILKLRPGLDSILRLIRLNALQYKQVISHKPALQERKYFSKCAGPEKRSQDGRDVVSLHELWGGCLQNCSRKHDALSVFLSLWITITWIDSRARAHRQRQLSHFGWGRTAWWLQIVILLKPSAIYFSDKSQIAV